MKRSPTSLITFAGMTIRPLVLLIGVFVLALIASRGALGVETVKFRDGEKVRYVVAEILLEDQTGALMLQADDGHLWTLKPDQILSRTANDQPLKPIDGDEMERRMLAEMPSGFSVHRTTHYLIVHNSSKQYAKQVGALFEQLYRGFFTYWENQHWELPEPTFPLVAIVLKDHDAFLKYAVAEIGETAKSIIGYYNLASNRMTTFNVPNLERKVSTIIHEATHQLAYNCGLQQRLADNPMWVSEGLATFFESPDLRNPRQWKGIGRVNRVNLERWRKYVPNRPAESLATLLCNDSRYRNAATAESAYAEGWALTYFLIKTNRRKKYVKYLRLLSEGRPRAERTPRERIAMFEKAFDTTLVELDVAFLKYMRRVRLE
jgi:hypothetical protein